MAVRVIPAASRRVGAKVEICIEADRLDELNEKPAKDAAVAYARELGVARPRLEGATKPFSQKNASGQVVQGYWVNSAGDIITGKAFTESNPNERKARTLHVISDAAE